MRYSTLFGKTSKTAPHDADSVNARLLIQGGFIDQLMAGVYTYLPLGLRSLDKIRDIVREEMQALGGQEILMPAVHPREPWEQTGRWDEEVMFHVQGRGEREYGLGWTHEEIVTPLAKRFIRSYKDLPLSVFQIQDKFRNEPRAKSGLLRGREFSMKDLYSFHRDEADLADFYRKVSEAYSRVFERCGLDAIVTEASGGTFSKYSHEFQVLTENGEDTIFYCEKCRYAQNKEVSEYKDGDKCPKCGGIMREGRSIEVGNIFELKTKYTDVFGVTYKDENGEDKPVLMGCYGIGPSRVLGAVVEVHHDERGIRWPKSVAPFHAYIVAIPSRDEAATRRVWDVAESLERDLERSGVEALFDDREGVSAGEKFADADLLGIPVRLIVSEKVLGEDSVEWKARQAPESKLVPIEDVVALLKSSVE